MALIDGLPTVIGGVSSREFLQSIEVLDNSVDEAAPLGMDWRISAHALMHPVRRATTYRVTPFVSSASLAVCSAISAQFSPAQAGLGTQRNKPNLGQQNLVSDHRGNPVPFCIF